MKVTRRRLIRKLLVLLLLPTIVCIAGYAAVTAAYIWRGMEREADRELIDEVATLKATLPIIAESADRAQLAALTEGISQRQRVHGIALYDRTCTAIARSPDLNAAARTIDGLVCGAVRGGATEWHGVARLGGASTLLRVEKLDGAGEIGFVAATYRLADVEAIIRRDAITLTVMALLLVTIMAAVALLIARSMAAPLGALVDAADRVAQGDLSVHIPPSNQEELRRVTDAFNHMVAALADAQARAAHAEQERLAFEHRVLHTQALAVVGQVAASLAHDIGSPLSIILGWARLTAADGSLPSHTREEASAITAQCERIRRMLTQLMAVARPPAHALAPVDLAAVVREVAGFLGPECRHRRIDVTLDVARDLPLPVADRDRLVQVVLNLCVNAIGVQDTGGRLVLRVAPAGDGVALEVRDAGPGVPQALRTKIFELFYSTRQRHGGNGLGLPIVAQIVRQLDGEIVVDDAPEGGACFRITLPCGPPKLAAVETSAPAGRGAVSCEPTAS